MGQFLLVGYFMLGGAYALQMGSAVRMDVFYGSLGDPRTKAAVDVVTIFCAAVLPGRAAVGRHREHAIRAGIRRAAARACGGPTWRRSRS
jgi:TRAP-type mannitol/chloroaromatic compound transport system permease small subunit